MPVGGRCRRYLISLPPRPLILSEETSVKALIRLFLVCVVLLTGVAVCHAAPPNIILIMTDDQGYGDLACHGNPIIQTPHLDKLHSESVRFTDFHVSPTCAPTRSALMTGRHEFKNGVTHTILERERLTLNAVTLPQVLTAAGYSTGIFGKWHLGDERDRWPDRRGFQEMFIHGAGGIGQTYPGTCGDAPGNRYFDPVILHNGRFEKTSGYCTDVFFSQALQWIESQRDKPFFAYITPNAPHGPLVVADEWVEPYRGKVPEDVAKFYGMIANIDVNVGKLRARLDELKLTRDTLLIFMTDNGTATGSRVFNAGMRGAKGSAWNGGTRVPAFWCWPGTFAPREVPALTAHLDIFPTLAAVAGATLDDKAARQIEGRSLLPLIKEESSVWPDRFLFTHKGRWPDGADPNAHQHEDCSVHWRNYHLVCQGTGGKKQWSLYDLAADPGEEQNLTDSLPEVVKTMDEAYDAWWQSVRPAMENEGALAKAPKINPFRELYWQQYGGPGPNNVPPGTVEPVSPGVPKQKKAAPKKKAAA